MCFFFQVKDFTSSEKEEEEKEDGRNQCVFIFLILQSAIPAAHMQLNCKSVLEFHFYVYIFICLEEGWKKDRQVEGRDHMSVVDFHGGNHFFTFMIVANELLN